MHFLGPNSFALSCLSKNVVLCFFLLSSKVGLSQETLKSTLEEEVKQKEVKLTETYRSIVESYERLLGYKIKKASWFSSLPAVDSVDQEFQNNIRKIKYIQSKGLYTLINSNANPQIYTWEYLNEIYNEGFDLAVLLNNIELFKKNKAKNEVLGYFPEVENGSVILEIGGGYDDLAKKVFENSSGITFYSGDIDSNAVRLMEDYYINQPFLKDKNNEFRVVLSDEKSTKTEHKLVVYVIMRHAFHHFDYPKTMLRSIKRSCKPTTQLILYEPFEPFVQFRENICEYAMNKRELIKYFEREGFTLNKIGKKSAFDANHFLLFKMTP